MARKDYGRKPDYRLKALNKLTNNKASIGAGWKNKDGSISIDLNPFITLSSEHISVTDLVITLFPIETEDKSDE